MLKIQRYKAGSNLTFLITNYELRINLRASLWSIAFSQLLEGLRW